MLKVGTDFSGIGSPEAALRRLNIPHKNVFACEIDKFAKQSYLELNNPDTFYEDITTRNHSEVEQLDLYVAGFPCQAFSYAGNRKGFADETRGTLFFDVAEFIRENQPNCFVLENVRGLVSHDKGRTFQTIIDILSNGGGSVNGQVGLDTIDNGLGYHIYYKILNTKNFGIPQNRERIFIVGFKYWREFNFPKEFPLKETLKDLLEDDVNEKYYLSDRAIQGIKNSTYERKKSIIQNDICATLLSRDYKDPKCVKVHSLYETNNKRLNQNYDKHKDELEKGNSDIVIHNLHPRCGDPKKGGTGHLSKTDGIAYCLDAANSIAVEINKYDIKEQVCVRKHKVDIIGLQELLHNHKNITNKEISEKLNVMKTTVDHWFRKDAYFSIPEANIWHYLKDLLNIKTDKYDKSITEFEVKDGVFEKANRVYDVNGLSPTITSTRADEKIIDFKREKQIRRLTPLETWRLQGFTDEEFYKAEKVNSDTQLYKQAGNTITVNVLVELFKKIYLK